jgi:hypothetical protein
MREYTLYGRLLEEEPRFVTDTGSAVREAHLLMETSGRRDTPSGRRDRSRSLIAVESLGLARRLRQGSVSTKRS